jgi:hypothetical protein
MKPKDKAMIASYLRSFLGAVAALYMSGITDPKVLVNAGIAAIIPPVLRWLNPKDPSFGRDNRQG